MSCFAKKETPPSPKSSGSPSNWKFLSLSGILQFRNDSKPVESLLLSPLPPDTHTIAQQLHMTGPVFPLNFCNSHSPFNPRFCYSLIQRFGNCERNRFNLIHIKYRFVDHSCSLRMLHNACNWIPNFPSKPISGLMDGYLPYIDSTKLIHPQSKINYKHQASIDIYALTHDPCNL